MTVQRSDLVALQNEIDRLWAENRLLREKIATTWEQVVARKVVFGRVNGGHSDFSTAQDAIDWAASNGYYTVWFPGGNYAGIAITTSNLQILCEANAIFDGGTTAHALSVSGCNYVRVVGGKWGTGAGEGNNYDAAYINSQYTQLLNLHIVESDRYGVHLAAGADYCPVTGCTFIQGQIDSDSLIIDAGATYNAVVGNARLAGDWTNNGGATNKISDDFNS